MSLANSTMNPFQNSQQSLDQKAVDGDNPESYDSTPQQDIPKVRSTPPSESARTVISGAFFAGAHTFKIIDGSFNHTDGDMHQDIVYDHSHRSNFGNKYGDNHSNTNNRTNNYNGDYNVNRTHGSNYWTQASARTQYHDEQIAASGRGRGGRSSAPPISAISSKIIHDRPSSARLPVNTYTSEGDDYAAYDREEEPQYYDPQYEPYYQDYRTEGINDYRYADEEIHQEQPQRQPEFEGPRAYDAESEPGLASTQFKSRNPFAKMMSPQ
ncbi:hypothetical protein J3R30DRAFT_118948 [Lentinula aciculospora]|uniref:Uncharacterized protein n=1 Tax=Lentinula aciculospora TaxID=153920 RepID=A0A9W9AWT6_9AGAR|nr:hypothetical protein J3R30DRAFT_118948 [Lentinula aciculospora]